VFRTSVDGETRILEICGPNNDDEHLCSQLKHCETLPSFDPRILMGLAAGIYISCLGNKLKHSKTSQRSDFSMYEGRERFS